MSVDKQQLKQLQLDMAMYGAKVTYIIDTDGCVGAVCIVGARGIKKEYWDSVLSAAERMREWLYEQRVMNYHPERVR